MKISTRSRYGLRFLMELASRRSQGKPIYLSDIAKSQEISEKYLSKLVIPLRGAGILQSARGAHGGYILARDPSKVTLREIIEVLEGGMSLLDCTERVGSCAREPLCVARDIWGGLEKAMRDYCESITLNDIVNRCAPEVLDFAI
jgi:Rrf2 family protein